MAILTETYSKKKIQGKKASRADYPARFAKAGAAARKAPSKKAKRIIRAFDNSLKFVVVFKGDINKKRFSSKGNADLYNAEHFQKAGQVMTFIQALKKGYE